VVVPSLWGACSPALTAVEGGDAGSEEGVGGRSASAGGQQAAPSGGTNGSEGGSGGKSDGSGAESDGSGGEEDGSGGKSDGSGGKNASGGETGTDEGPAAGGGGSDGETGSGEGAPTCEEECPDNASCVSHGESASCQCDEGFEEDGDACVDIDECEEEEPCDEKATCNNTKGSYECTCDAGLVGDGHRCFPRTRPVSVSITGQLGNSGSMWPSISDDGRFVAFYSYSTDLVENDNNNYSIFVYDTEEDKMSRVSASSSGVEAKGVGWFSSISGDGRYVVFTSKDDSLVPNDLNGVADLFRHDRMTGETIRINVSSNGTASNSVADDDFYPSISIDGNRVVFSSKATNLIPDDKNGQQDVFMREVAAGTTTLVNLKKTDPMEGGAGACASISGSGRYVVFTANTTDFEGGDDGFTDVYRRDLHLNETRLVSRPWTNKQIDGASGSPSVTPDGRYVVFRSAATTLVAADVSFPATRTARPTSLCGIA
jgi:Tol biopolymer transport system component